MLACVSGGRSNASSTFWRARRGGSHISFRMQCLIIMLANGESITNDILKSSKSQILLVVIYFFLVYLIIDEKGSFRI